MTAAEAICSRVLEQYGVTWADMVGPDRRLSTVEARDAVCWTLHQQQEKPFAHEYSNGHIGRILGGRGETTIKGAIARHEARLEALDRIRERSYAYASRPMERAA